MKMLKKSIQWAAVAVVCVAACSAEARQDEITLVLVPREEGTVKVGMDLANRYPTLLLSYLVGANGAVSLHGWTGTRWVNVTVEDYQAGNFFQNAPNSAVVVEKDGQRVPESLIPPEVWAPSAFVISTTETRPLLHLIGQYYDFKYKDWQWFANRYGMTVDSINPEGLNIGWYHRSLSENIARSGGVANQDLIFWKIIRMPAPPVEEIAVVEEPLELDQLETNVPEEPVVDPFTNSVPDAVILGAGDAEETVITEPVDEVIIINEGM